jgi:hypothetical protein
MAKESWVITVSVSGFSAVGWGSSVVGELVGMASSVGGGTSVVAATSSVGEGNGKAGVGEVAAGDAQAPKIKLSVSMNINRDSLFISTSSFLAPLVSFVSFFRHPRFTGCHAGFSLSSLSPCLPCLLFPLFTTPNH